MRNWVWRPSVMTLPHPQELLSRVSHTAGSAGSPEAQQVCSGFAQGSLRVLVPQGLGRLSSAPHFGERFEFWTAPSTSNSGINWENKNLGESQRLVSGTDLGKEVWHEGNSQLKAQWVDRLSVINPIYKLELSQCPGQGEHFASSQSGTNPFQSMHWGVMCTGLRDTSTPDLPGLSSCFLFS